MTVLDQCQKWNERGEYQKIIDALEAVPNGERSPEMDSELARAYNNAADFGDKELFRKAISLLRPHEEYFNGDHCWNFRMAYAYYFLEQEGTAVKYFEKALEARPEDEDTEEFIEACRQRLVLPVFEKSFSERVAEAWKAFENIEGELRRLIDEEQEHKNGEKLISMCQSAIEIAIEDPAFELCIKRNDDEKYELILSAEGMKHRLFPLVYFKRHAPASVLEYWDIFVGRQPSQEFDMRSDEIELSGKDVMVKVEKLGEKQVSLILYCEKLLPLLREDENKAWWMLSVFTDQILGEVASISLICDFNVSDSPVDVKDGGENREYKIVTIDKLAGALMEMGLDVCNDAEDYLKNSYIAYEMEPVKERDADYRLDVHTGTAGLPALINEYLSNDDGIVNSYHADGIAAGFIAFSADSFKDKGNSDKKAAEMLDFRDNLEKAILKKTGEDAVCFLGGASGLYCEYLDFIAWDLQAVLSAAAEFLEEAEIEQAAFHSFRRDVEGVWLIKPKTEQEKNQEKDWEDVNPQIDPETGSLLSAEDIEAMESFLEESQGYYYKMFGYIEDFLQAGIEERRFTLSQARKDIQIALWYSFACNNIDEYEYYYKACQWMPYSEENADGCGTWYYRYSVALTYCGRLEEAYRYAEEGAAQEPDYPWIWLQLGKLRAHAGDKAGALEAVKHGLELEPGDYEFLTLKKEIEDGASLEQMEYHWIDPNFDRQLQDGLAEDSDDKQRAVSCITVNEAGLEFFRKLFRPEPESYIKDSPYCTFPYMVGEDTVELIFCMNEAGISKLSHSWLESQKETLDAGFWLIMTNQEGKAGVLDAVLFRMDYKTSLIYRVTGEKDMYFQVWLDGDGSVLEGSDDTSFERTSYRDSGNGSSDEHDGYGSLELYDEKEMEVVENHIQKYFGEFKNVFHEIVSDDIHVDICVIPPARGRDYYTLVTMGMGAHEMNVPEELEEYNLSRAEIAIALPADWKFDEKALNDEKWYWPVRLLKTVARLPINCDTWIGWGHTIDNQKAFAENTALCGSMLTEVQNVEGGAEICVLPNGEHVNFYQIIPLYRDEMQYKIKHSADDIIDKMPKRSFVIYPDRKSFLGGPMLN